MTSDLSRKTFDEADDTTKLNLLYDRTEHIVNKLDTVNETLKKSLLWHRGFSALGGFIGGLISSICMFWWRR